MIGFWGTVVLAAAFAAVLLAVAVAGLSRLAGFNDKGDDDE